MNSYYGKGFRSTTTNVLNVDLVLDQKLDFITKGLSFKLKGSYNTSYWTQKIASSSMAVYTPVLHDDGSIGYRKSGSDSQLSYSRNSMVKVNHVLVYGSCFELQSQIWRS